MHDVRDFTAPALKRSFGALQDVSFRLEDPELVIGLRAFHGFRPLALDGQLVVLKTHTIDGWRGIRGRLVHAPDLPHHGTWYKYRFLPESDHEIFFIDTGRCHWTNVERIEFIVQLDGYFLRNRLFRPVSGALVAKVV